MTPKADTKEVKEAEIVDTKAVTPTKVEMDANAILGQDPIKRQVKIAIKEDMPTLLIGETGTGKTTLIREQAIAQKKDIIRFSITGETTVDEFVGKYELEAGKTIWRDGVLLDAMRNGKWLVADEVNAALPEILFVLHSLLDDDKFVTVTQHGGEVVTPHKDFRFFATMNPTDEYAGTKQLNKAFQSRFEMVLKVAYPDPKTEAEIVAGKSGCSLEDATRMADVAAALRTAKSKDKIFYTCSTRDLIHWGKLTKHLSPKDAFISSILNKCDGDDEEVARIFQGVIGTYIKLSKAGHPLNIDWIKKEKEKLDKERKDFDAHKTQLREEITQEIIRSLTTAGVKETPKPEAKAEQQDIDDIFGAF